MRLKQQQEELQGIGFQEQLTDKCWKRQEGRMVFVVKQLNDRMFLLGITQDTDAHGETLHKLRYMKTSSIEHIAKIVEQHVEGLKLKTLRELQGGLINTQVYDLIKRSKRVAVRILKQGKRTYFRQMTRGANGVVASTEMYQCFESVKTGYYTMTLDEWERIQHYTKFM